MKKNITLVIMAAGMGSRFGGLKQIEPMGPSNEFIIDYSIYDAIKAGFNKVVFIIKEENFTVFKETIGKRVEPHINVEYVFQKNDNIPDEYQEIKNREKPLGTAQAILCCKEKVHEPFAIINADDFYGRDAYFKASEFLLNVEKTDKENYGMIGYIVKNTMSSIGSVKRGICEVENGYLKKLTESKVERKDGIIVAQPLSGKTPFTVSDDTTVSMNMWGFTKSILEEIKAGFPAFLDKGLKENPMKCEYFLPTVVSNLLAEDKATVSVLKSADKWYGVTYKEDKPVVVAAIQRMKDEGLYPQHLWEGK